MSTTTEVQADLEEVCRAAAEKRHVDPEVARRVHARAEAAREELRKRGLTDVAVSLIREAREE
jgi:hypothetical protein